MGASSKGSFHIVGDAFVDLFCFLEHDMPETGGDALLSSPVEKMAGGSAVNTTTHLASLLNSIGSVDGAEQNQDQVHLHTAVNPNDQYGQVQLSHAKLHGFSLHNGLPEESQKDISTGHCIVIVANNERSFMTHQGCMQHFQVDHIRWEDMAETNTDANTPNNIFIHVAGYYNLTCFWDGMLQTKLKSIREQLTDDNTNVTISLVPQHDASGKWEGGLQHLLPHLDYFILNRLEATQITRQPDSCHNPEQHWAAFFGEKCRDTWAIVTLGPDGALAMKQGKIFARQKAVKVERVVDPTGAGDAFAAGFLYGLHCISPRLSIQSALLWGCSVASSCVMTRGASVPSKKQHIEDFFQRRIASS